jgi:hypothetical protein
VKGINQPVIIEIVRRLPAVLIRLCLTNLVTENAGLNLIIDDIFNFLFFGIFFGFD